MGSHAPVPRGHLYRAAILKERSFAVHGERASLGPTMSSPADHDSTTSARSEGSGAALVTDTARKPLRPRTRNAPRWHRDPLTAEPDTSSPEWLAYIAGTH